MIRWAFSLFAGFLFLFFPNTVPAQEKAWQEFVLKEGNFKVQVPVAPLKMKEEKRDGKELADIGIKTLSYGCQYREVAYFISVFDFSRNQALSSGLSGDAAQRLLDNMRNGGLRETKSKLIGEKNLTLDGYIGREDRSVSESGQYFRTHSFILPQKAVVIGIATNSKEKIESDEVKRFFDSLALVGIEKKPPVPTLDVEKLAWKEFAPENERFAILLPGTPEERSQIRPTKVGEIKVSAWVWKNEVSSVTLTSVDFGDILQDQKNVLLSFDSARNNILKQTNGKLISETSVDLNGIPCRDLVLAADQFQMKIRLLAYQNRQYSLLVTLLRPEPVSEEHQKYYKALAGKVFDSLTFRAEKPKS